MTVSATDTLTYSYSGDGSTVAFAYSTKFDEAADLVVLIEDADGDQTVQTLTTHYSVSGAGESGGGTVTMVTAPAAGETIRIYRDTTRKQIVDLADNARNPAQSVEDQMDRTIRIAQDLGNVVGRAVKVKVGGTAPVFPEAEAATIIGWDAAGNALVNKTAGDLGTLVVGEDVQGHSANLDAWSALPTSAKLSTATYDPTGVEADAFDRANHIGVVQTFDYVNRTTDPDAPASGVRFYMKEAGHGGLVDIWGRPMGMPALILAPAPLDEDLTLDIPTDYATLQEAIDAWSIRAAKQGVTITLNIETGHTLTSGLTLANGDYSHFLITSVDAEVPTGFVTTQLFVMENCAAPVFDVMVDGNSQIEECYRFTGCRAKINPATGAKNFTGRALYANNTMIQAGSTVWENNQEIFITNGSGFSFGSATITGHTLSGITVSEGSTGGIASSTITNCGMGLHLKDAAVVDAEFIVISGCSDEAVRVDDASVTLDRAELLLCESEAINMINGRVNAPQIEMTAAVAGSTLAVRNRGGYCGINQCVVSGFTGWYHGDGASTGSGDNCSVTGVGSGNGILVEEGAVFACTDGSVTGFSAGNDARVLRGGIIALHGTATSTSGTSGNSPDLADTSANGAGGFDAVLGSGRGIIWA